MDNYYFKEVLLQLIHGLDSYFFARKKGNMAIKVTHLCKIS